MTDSLVNGYLIVSSPTEDAPYRGVDREPWELIDSSYYDRDLPDEILQLFERIRRGCDIWWPISKSRSDADRMLDYTQEQGHAAELIGVLSPYLSHTLGCCSWVEPDATLIGIDVISVGEWSLLRALQEASVRLPDDLRALMNDAYLLRNESGASWVEQYYRLLAAQEVVEPIADSDSGVPTEPVAVYALRMK